MRVKWKHIGRQKLPVAYGIAAGHDDGLVFTFNAKKILRCLKVVIVVIIKHY